jgi:hypothetical protein
MWLAIFALIAGLVSFIAAFFPRWDLRWGGHTGPAFAKRVPISVEGRVAFGIYFAYFGFTIIMSGYKPSLWYPMLAILIVLMIGLYIIYRRDRRKRDNLIPES